MTNMMINKKITEAYQKMVCEGIGIPEEEIFGTSTAGGIYRHTRNGGTKRIGTVRGLKPPYEVVRKPDSGHWIVADLDANGVPVKSDSANGENANAFAEFTMFDELVNYCTAKIRSETPIVVKEIGKDGNEHDVDLKDIVRASRQRDSYLAKLRDRQYHKPNLTESANEADNKERDYDGGIEVAFKKGVHSAAEEINSGINGLLQLYTSQSFNSQSDEFKTAYETVMSLKEYVEALLELSNA